MLAYGIEKDVSQLRSLVTDFETSLENAFLKARNQSVTCVATILVSPTGERAAIQQYHRDDACLSNLIFSLVPKVIISLFS